MTASPENAALTQEDMRLQVLDVVPRIREEAARTEAERRIPTEVLAALLDSGLFAIRTAGATDREHPLGQSRRFVPDSLPGAVDPSPPAEVLELVHMIAGACGSTGWMAAHAAAASWLLRQFPKTVRSQLTSEQGVDPLVAFSAEAGGRLTEQEDGLHLSGRWATVAGAEYASWLVLAARRETATGAAHTGLVLVETAQCRALGSTDNVGMTAIGAHDVRVDDVALSPEAWLPVDNCADALAAVATIIAMALLGSSQGALDIHLEQTRQRVDLTHSGEDAAMRDLSPARVARAASALDAAALVLSSRPSDDLYPRSVLDDARYAVERSAEAAGLVFTSVRSHALANDDPVARLWRDVEVGAHYARALISRLRWLSP